MKKILAISLLVVSVFFAGCSNASDSVDEANNTDITEEVSNEYYILINEDYDTYENGQYIYSSDGYNEVGEAKSITFQTAETLELQTVVKVQVEDDDSTSEPVTIDIDDVPEAVKEKLLAD